MKLVVKQTTKSTSIYKTTFLLLSIQDRIKITTHYPRALNHVSKIIQMFPKVLPSDGQWAERHGHGMCSHNTAQH